MPTDVSALQLVLTADPALMAIVRLSLLVSLLAVFFGALIGVPFGAGLALTQFRGREAMIVILNALMGLPPVVVGLLVFLLLSRAGDEAEEPEPGRLGFVLQISRFPWGGDPAAWLAAVTRAAAEAGFEGVALMDHLIQIPQVDRAWEPIPEPFVTLGLLAGLGTSLRLGTLVTPVSLSTNFRRP
jgi:ABC-type Fe3+ transport system permease subunit